MKKLLLFFFIFIFIALVKEILVFNEEIILLIASFIMFNIFVNVGWSVLNSTLITRTNEIYFIFYDLFELKLKKLELFKDLCVKKLQVNTELTEILKIIKLNLSYFYLLEIIYMYSFEVYILFSFLKNILLEEFYFLKYFFNKKLVFLKQIKNKENSLSTNNLLNNLFKILYFLKNISVLNKNNSLKLSSDMGYWTKYNNVNNNKIFWFLLLGQFRDHFKRTNNIQNNFYYLQSFLIFFQNHFNDSEINQKILTSFLFKYYSPKYKWFNFSTKSYNFSDKLNSTKLLENNLNPNILKKVNSFF